MTRPRRTDLITDAVPGNNDRWARGNHHAPISVVMDDAVLDPVVRAAGDDDAVAGAADVAVQHLDVLALLDANALRAAPAGEAVKTHIRGAEALDAVAVTTVNESPGAARPLDRDHSANLAPAVARTDDRSGGIGIVPGVDEHSISRRQGVGGQNGAQRKCGGIRGEAAVRQRTRG